MQIVARLLCLGATTRDKTFRRSNLDLRRAFFINCA
jgi:hypothetical protein